MKAQFFLDLRNYPNYRNYFISVLENAALYASDKAAKIARDKLKGQLKGRLGGALGTTSDLAEGKGVYRKQAGQFSASGRVLIRKGSMRAVGAIISATEGASIRPVNTQWLWIPTTELGIKRIGRKKVTPALYNQAGYDKRIGPLVLIPGRSPNEALLVIKQVQTKIVGGGRPSRNTRSGIPRKGRQNVEQIVAFIGIKQTQRTKYVDVKSTIRAVQNGDLDGLIMEGMRRNA